MSETIQIILADDHEIVRTGIKIILESEGDIEVVAEASDGEEAVKLAEENKPDLMVLDIRMPKLNGIETTSVIKRKFPEMKVLILSMHEDEEYILKSVDEGADGYLLKDTSKPEFIKAIHSICDGDKYFAGDISSILVNRYLSAKNKQETVEKTAPTADYQLTKRERQILRMTYMGISNKDIADQLQKSVRTVETHRFNIMKKLGVNNIAELLHKVNDDQSLKREIDEAV
ncbi:MAG: response regulator transcription factor [Bacteroidota bacterium]